MRLSGRRRAADDFNLVRGAGIVIPARGAPRRAVAFPPPLRDGKRSAYFLGNRGLKTVILQPQDLERNASARPTNPARGIAPGRFRGILMTTLPADWDYAKALLSIFDDAHVRPGQSLRAGDVQLLFQRRNMGRENDYRAALEYSLDLGWLASEWGRLRLTKAGFEEI
jgi:hypothetical protein